MSQKLIVTDFDRTLFDVNAFFLDFCELILADESITNLELRANIDEFINSGDHSDFHHFMNRYHIDLQNIIGKVQHTLGSKSYLYEDVTKFLRYFSDDEIIILTTGRQEFQQVKLQLVNEFATINKIVIPGNKGEYLKEKLKIVPQGFEMPTLTGTNVYSELYLIDDKIDMLMPLIGMKRVKLFNIQRPDAKFIAPNIPAGITKISSMVEVK